MAKKTMYLDCFLQGLIPCKIISRKRDKNHRQWLYTVRLTCNKPIHSNRRGEIRVNVPAYNLKYKTEKRMGIWYGRPIDLNILDEIVSNLNTS